MPEDINIQMALKELEKESHVSYISYYDTTDKCFQRWC